RASAEVCVRCHPERRRLPDSSKALLVILDHFYRLRRELVLVTPTTVRRWAKEFSKIAFRLRARRMGRRPFTDETIAVIQKLARENPGWSPGKIARTATTQLGLNVTANSVRKYLPHGDPRKPKRRQRPEGSERWSTFIRNHAAGLLAMDFAVVRTLLGGILYVHVVMQIGTRRI